MSMKDAAIRQAMERATRDGENMHVCVYYPVPVGLDPIWYVRSDAEGVPPGSIHRGTAVYANQDAEFVETDADVYGTGEGGEYARELCRRLANQERERGKR